MPFQIVRNDITQIKADAIVNTCNPEVAIGDGVDSAIYKAAGKDLLFAARKKIGYLEPGQVGITPAFHLDAKYIIHASGPWWEGGSKGEAELLRQCYDKSLSLASENNCKSIAFPLLATGTYRFPKKLGIQIAVDAFTSFLEEHEMEITLVVFGSDSVKITGELGEEIAESLVDDVYVGAAFASEYIHDGYPFFDEEGEDAISTENDFDENIAAPKFLASTSIRKATSVETPAMAASSLDDVLKDIYTESFAKHLQRLINKKGLKNSQVYAAANVSKQYFSKLLKGQVKPSKEKVLSLAVGLRLNMDEAIDFLQMAGYAFSPISQTDAVVQYFIEHEDYNVIKINFVLFDYGLDGITNE